MLYSITQDIISYLQLVQSFSQSPEYYPPETVLQGIYGSSYYHMLESELINENNYKDLVDLTAKSLRKLVPWIRGFAPKGMIIGYDDTQYDPTIRFYKMEDGTPVLKMFIDLPSYTLWIYPSKRIADLQQAIAKRKDIITKLHAQREELMQEYDYTLQKGVTKALMKFARHENAKEASEAVADVDKRIEKQYQLIQQTRDEISRLEKNDSEESEWRNVLQKQLSGYGIKTDTVQLAKEDQ